MSDKFDRWFESEYPYADLSQRETLKGYNNLKYGWNAALSSLQGEAVAVVCNAVSLHTTTGRYNTINTCLKHGTKLFTFPLDASAKIAELTKELEETRKALQGAKAYFDSDGDISSDSERSMSCGKR